MEKVNQDPVVKVYVEKRDYELNQLSELESPVSVDGLLQLQLLSAPDERILVHNVANLVRYVLENSEQYSVKHFLADVSVYAGKPELRYWQLFNHCPELSAILLEEKHITDLSRLLAHFAAKQNHFLIEVMNMELQNGVTYAVAESVQSLDANQIKRYLFNLQPFKSYQKEINYTSEQLQFLSMMLLNKAVMIAEGVFVAEAQLAEEFGFRF